MEWVGELSQAETSLDPAAFESSPAKFSFPSGERSLFSGPESRKSDSRTDFLLCTAASVKTKEGPFWFIRINFSLQGARFIMTHLKKKLSPLLAASQSRTLQLVSPAGGGRALDAAITSSAPFHAKDMRASNEHGCQMAIAKSLYCMRLALQASRTMATLRDAAPSTQAQSKERKGSNFAA